MKKILLVDDEESIQLLYHEEFVDDGYQVVGAMNGEEALKKFTADPPDLVILDIQMPGLDGQPLGHRSKPEAEEQDQEPHQQRIGAAQRGSPAH